MNNAAQKTMSSNALKPFFLTCRVLAMSLLVIFATGCAKEEKAAPQAPEVDVVDVVQKDVPVYSEWVGTTDGLVNATIRAQVTGYLIKQNYKEGDAVKKDQVLFEIDPRVFQATLDQAKGATCTAAGPLEHGKGKSQAASDRLQRKMLSVNGTSIMLLDLNRKQHAALLSAQAALNKAKLDLGFTKVTSPIDGIAGIAKAQIGDLVGPGQIEELTTVSTVDPIKAYVPISEQEYIKAMQKGSAEKQKIALELILADGSTYPHKGEIAFADRQVDVKTGTIRVATIFPNPGNLLRPGQFARIKAATAIRNGALLVPQRAVTEQQGSYQVAVVSADNKVSIRPVKVADRIGSLWIITEGLKPGERVVAEGIQKVREGMLVVSKTPEASATAETAPAAPKDSEKR